jgi:ABC-type nickel/cobalt efflux system permease component RcnA
MHYHHDHGHGHSHGHHHHHHIPEGPITLRGLIALGISGGMVPCPSALVVLLAAIALHRVAYGMMLITAFSLGLAAVLVAIGVAVVYAGNWLERLPASGVWTRRLPTISAVCITLVGLILVMRAVAMF